MSNLVIGQSQLSHYFPAGYQIVSSRPFTDATQQLEALENLCSHRWESVYLTFSEQRIYDKLSYQDYHWINFSCHHKIIEALKGKADRIVCYTSAELWANHVGPISGQTPFNFSPTNYYAASKSYFYHLCQQYYPKVIFIHPFFFNSIYRSPYFLFGQIYQSLQKKEKIKVRNLNVYRDLVHASYVVERSLAANTHEVVGSGELVNLRTFVQDLYRSQGLDFYDYVKEESILPVFPQKFHFAQVSPGTYPYSRLFKETINELLK